MVLVHDEEVDQLFSSSGTLADGISGFRPRQSQTDMARAVAQAIAGQTALIVEAGTGTGKTFAYLVPALLWGGKVIVSTGTKNLQDQLFLRDIPVVRKALNVPVSVALLKGRANYVCHFHLERTLQNGRLTAREDVGYLRDIGRFIKTTSTGDKAELSKDTGVAELLPSANTVIFDEAHQLPETATLFFGEDVSTSQIMELCRDVLAEGLTHARDGADWGALVASLEKSVRDLRLTFPPEGTRLAFAQIAASSPFFPALEHVKDMLSHMVAVLATQAERAETIEQCRVRAVEIGIRLADWKEVTDESLPPTVLWVEAFSQSVQLHRTPLSIAPIFSKQREGPPRAWIFTSATLAVKQDFTHYSSQLGLTDETAMSLPSPFDYERQALLYSPTILPQPNSPDYTDAVIDAALPVIEAAGGRTFFLCTTLRAVKKTAERLRDEFERRKLPYPLFVQGEIGRTELLTQFRKAGNAVLIGSQSFWEGVDVPGDALSVVIIDKLPFAPPDDPVLAARITDMEKRGLNGFMNHQLPEAIINLKQGAGRLIRDESDRGVLMICDPRMLSKPYGRRIWQSLPPFARTRELTTVHTFLQNLSR